MLPLPLLSRLLLFSFTDRARLIFLIFFYEFYYTYNIHNFFSLLFSTRPPFKPCHQRPMPVWMVLQKTNICVLFKRRCKSTFIYLCIFILYFWLVSVPFRLLRNTVPHTKDTMTKEKGRAHTHRKKCHLIEHEFFRLLLIWMFLYQWWSSFGLIFIGKLICIRRIGQNAERKPMKKVKKEKKKHKNKPINVLSLNSPKRFVEGSQWKFTELKWEAEKTKRIAQNKNWEMMDLSVQRPLLHINNNNNSLEMKKTTEKKTPKTKRPNYDKDKRATENH